MKTFRGMFFTLMIGLTGLLHLSACNNDPCDNPAADAAYCGPLPVDKCADLAARLSNGLDAKNQESYWSCKTSDAQHRTFIFFDDRTAYVSPPEVLVLRDWAVLPDSCEMVEISPPPCVQNGLVCPPSIEPSFYLTEFQFFNQTKFKAQLSMGSEPPPANQWDEPTPIECQKSPIQN